VLLNDSDGQGVNGERRAEDGERARCTRRLGRSTTLRPAHNGMHFYGQKPSHCVDHDYHHCLGDLDDFATHLARPEQRGFSGYEPGSCSRFARGGGLVWLGAGLYRSLPTGNHRAAASALSSGRVLKAIVAPGAALWTALMTASNNARRLGGRRTPAPMTTQS